MGYKKLEIWQLAREIVIDIHKMTLLLPKFVRRTPSERCMRRVLK
jgi:hypothetical protein